MIVQDPLPGKTKFVSIMVRTKQRILDWCDLSPSPVSSPTHTYDHTYPHGISPYIRWYIGSSSFDHCRRLILKFAASKAVTTPSHASCSQLTRVSWGSWSCTKIHLTLLLKQIDNCISSLYREASNRWLLSFVVSSSHRPPLHAHQTKYRRSLHIL